MAAEPAPSAGYEIFDHTADVGVRAWGADPAEAFARAARGMLSVILGEDPAVWRAAGSAGDVTVAVAGAGWDDLLVNWLAELLFYVDVEAFVPRGFRFERCAPPRCVATLTGLRLHHPEQAAGVAVKAVTYHQLRVDVAPGRTEIEVILDI